MASLSSNTELFFGCVSVPLSGMMDVVSSLHTAHHNQIAILVLILLSKSMVLPTEVCLSG